MFVRNFAERGSYILLIVVTSATGRSLVDLSCFLNIDRGIGYFMVHHCISGDEPARTNGGILSIYSIPQARSAG